MSRIAPPAEKIEAVGAIYRALWDEMDDSPIDRMDARVQAVLLDIAGRLAMGTDTRDMGILGQGQPQAMTPPPYVVAPILPEGYDPEDPYARE